MTYKGKKSVTVYNPVCTVSPDSGSFYSEAVFAREEDAQGLIDEWVESVTTYKDIDGTRRPMSRYKVEKECDGTYVTTAEYDFPIYIFRINPMAYFK